MWDGKFRRIEIKVSGEKLHARYRDGYYAKQDNSGPADPEKEMLEMASGPLDSSALSMMVSGRHMKPEPAATGRELDFQVGVDVAQLLLDHTGGQWKGGADLMFVQKDEKGAVVAAEKRHVDMDFTDAQYPEMVAKGAIFERHLTLVPDATHVRMLVRDAGSGRIGTVTVPLRAFFPEASGTKPN
jgi:hypothetical protein